MMHWQVSGLRPAQNFVDILDKKGDPRMALIEAKFKFEQETKGALRYREVDERGIEQAGAKIGSLYLRKSAFEPGAAYPQTLRVIVEAVDP
jgi:hypothetical protein